jgi:hypothetical protein
MVPSQREECYQTIAVIKAYHAMARGRLVAVNIHHARVVIKKAALTGSLF